MNKTLMIIIAVVVIFAGIIMSGYNSLVSMNENVNGKWSQVENQLQRRNDLIPNLVNTVKGYAAHESDVFKAVSDARAKLGGAKTVAETSQANGELSSALSRLLMIAENYPDLKSQHQLPAAAGRAGRYGKPHCRSPYGLQRRSSGLQRQDQILPDCSLCRYVRF